MHVPCRPTGRNRILVLRTGAYTTSARTNQVHRTLTGRAYGRPSLANQLERVAYACARPGQLRTPESGDRHGDGDRRLPPRHHTNPTITVSMVRSDGISPPVSVGSPEKPSQPTQQASTQPVDGDVSPSFTCTKSPPKSALCIISASTHRLAPNLPRAPLRPRPPPPPTITSSTSPTTSLTSDQLLFPPLLPPRSPAIACRS